MNSSPVVVLCSPTKSRERWKLRLFSNSLRTLIGIEDGEQPQLDAGDPLSTLLFNVEQLERHVPVLERDGDLGKAMKVIFRLSTLIIDYTPTCSSDIYYVPVIAANVYAMRSLNVDRDNESCLYFLARASDWILDHQFNVSDGVFTSMCCITLRNMGYYYYNACHNVTRAVAAYHAALGLAPAHTTEDKDIDSLGILSATNLAACWCIMLTTNEQMSPLVPKDSESWSVLEKFMDIVPLNNLTLSGVGEDGNIDEMIMVMMLVAIHAVELIRANSDLIAQTSISSVASFLGNIENAAMILPALSTFTHLDSTAVPKRLKSPIAVVVLRNMAHFVRWCQSQHRPVLERTNIPEWKAFLSASCDVSLRSLGRKHPLTVSLVQALHDEGMELPIKQPAPPMSPVPSADKSGRRRMIGKNPRMRRVSMRSSTSVSTSTESAGMIPKPPHVRKRVDIRVPTVPVGVAHADALSEASSDIMDEDVAESSTQELSGTGFEEEDVTSLGDTDVSEAETDAFETFSLGPADGAPSNTLDRDAPILLTLKCDEDDVVGDLDRDLDDMLVAIEAGTQHLKRQKRRRGGRQGSLLDLFRNTQKRSDTHPTASEATKEADSTNVRQPHTQQSSSAVSLTSSGHGKDILFQFSAADDI